MRPAPTGKERVGAEGGRGEGVQPRPSVLLALPGAERPPGGGGFCSEAAEQLGIIQVCFRFKIECLTLFIGPKHRFFGK